jgi:thiopeptide-type bacteriocin biosynthesis protein
MKFLPQIIFRSPINSCTNNVINTGVFNEALYLSSPVLCNEYQKHLTQPSTDSKEIKKLDISLYKYLSRSKYRCTPFGLFAGLSIGSWGDENNIVLAANLKNTLNRKTRLDMNVLCNLAQELSKQDFIKPHLKFYPNTSIYNIGSHYRYIEYYYNNNNRFHKINKVDFSAYLQDVLRESKDGLTYSQLTQVLISEDISIDEAISFIDELVASQLLINNLEPTLTGDDYFNTLLNELLNINQINKSESLSRIITILKEVDILINQIDSSLFNPTELYKNIQFILKEILVELSETNLFQTDLYKINLNANSNKFTLNDNIQTKLHNTIHFLNKITPIVPNKNLDDFKKRFYERYEDYEIPLLIALDTETGIGYPNTDNNGVNELIDDVYASNSNTEHYDIKWSKLQTSLLNLITNSIKHNKKVIEVSEHDFTDTDFSNEGLPHSLSVMFKVLNSATQKISISSVGGSSAINLLGRFAGGNNQLNDIVKEIAEFEQAQSPHSILAEIVHLPESRTGNILARTSFRSYEIPYLAKASVDSEFQISMNDLTLKLKGDKIILFDNRLQKEIIPRLGNAHNYSFNSLPVYHFLCDLQTQYFAKSYVGFDWGVLVNQFDFLPRVEYKNVVLKSAKWQIRKANIEPLKSKQKSDVEKHNSFFELKNKLELPDIFLIADGDNELLIDCKKPIAIDTFIDIVKNRNEITLEEYLFEDDNSLIKDSDGNSFTNECIAILLNENTIKLKSEPISLIKKSSKQVFSIGSEWLYYKIYCGAKTADFILTEKIKHITETLLEKGIIDKWFFIRYADPNVHIRFRLHVSDFAKYGEILQFVNMQFEPLLNQHVISKIQTDTYKRELERYGDNSIELVESLFYADSVFVTDMLDMLDADSGGAIRWKMALRSVDDFLTDFNLNLEEKYSLINTLSTSFFNEHGGKKELKLTLDNKFRTLRPQLEEVLNKNNDEAKEYYLVIELINERSKANKKIIQKILLLYANKEMQLSINDLLASLLHMNLDRLFMGRNRTNEFVVYDLLTRYYKSNLARIKISSDKKITNN